MQELRRFTLIVSFMVACCFVQWLWAQCTTPNLSWYGWRPGASVSYQFIGNDWTPEQKAAIETALQRWTNASGHNTFTPVAPGNSPQLTFIKTDLGPTAGAGLTDNKGFDADGYLTGTGMLFTTNTALLSTDDGYLHFALHELGHTFGLDDDSATASSVMRTGVPPNGVGMPDYPTDCDAQLAWVYTPYWYPPVVGDACYAADPSSHEPPCDPDTEHWGDDGCCWPGPTGEISPDPQSPLILSLSDRQIRLSGAAQGVVFDILANGRPRRVAWPVSDDDAFLALDRNGNGLIDDGSELFGTSTPTPTGRAANGFEALRTLDANGDGRVDAKDPLHGTLLLWRDTNRDGISQPSELTRLADAGILAFSVEYHVSGRRDRWGNRFRYRSEAIAASRPRFRAVWDVYLQTLPVTTRPVPNTGLGMRAR